MSSRPTIVRTQEEDGEQEDEDSAMASADAAAIDDGAEATTFATGQAAADEEEGQDEVSGLDADGAATVTCCPSGHKLALLTADKSMTALSCDMCHGALSAGSDFFSCAACDYDLAKALAWTWTRMPVPLPRRPPCAQVDEAASNRSARRRRRQSPQASCTKTSSTRESRRGTGGGSAGGGGGGAAAVGAGAGGNSSTVRLPTMRRPASARTSTGTWARPQRDRHDVRPSERKPPRAAAARGTGEH